MIAMKAAIVIIFLLSFSVAGAQYAPAAGMPGTTAVYKDSAVFSAWASSVVVNRGWINISDTTAGKASYGSALDATGKADNNPVSLGDGGVATVSFERPVFNGPGWDFAVFENSFDGNFLELAFVEVSSDGVNFFRFPAHSLTQDTAQIGAFGTIDPTKIHNFAGKYKVGYGTPFDLDEMKNISGLDVDNIVKIRIVDVVGSINPQYATYDTAGNAVNDPWPVNFPSSGFDLDAVGAIHLQTGIDNQKECFLKIFPNPFSHTVYFKPADEELYKVRIFDLNGKAVFAAENKKGATILDLSYLPAGVYFFEIQNFAGVFRKKIIKIR